MGSKSNWKRELRPAGSFGGCSEKEGKWQEKEAVD
jgi:hypothetical protein